MGVLRGIYCASKICKRDNQSLRLHCSIEDQHAAWLAQMECLDKQRPIFEGGPVLHHRPIQELLASPNSSIPILDYGNASTQLVAKLIKHAVPFVLRHHPAARQLHRHWKQRRVREAIGFLPVKVVTFTGERFKYYDAKKRWPTGQSPGKEFGRRVRTTVEEVFLEAQKARANRLRLYASVMVRQKTMEVLDPSGAYLSLSADPLLQIPFHTWKVPHVRIGWDPVQVATHFDSGPNFLVQVRASKPVVLLHPLQQSKLYWEKDESHPYFRRSEIWPRDLQDPDHSTHLRDKYPLFGDARGIAHILQPTEVLHIPSMWWHYLEASDPQNDSEPFWTSINRFAEWDQNFLPPDAERYLPCIPIL